MLKFISNIPKNIFLFFIKFYQVAASPFFPRTCRHIPSCSCYSKEAIERYGALKGFWLSVKRISRCHPWGSYGYDPLESKR